MVQNDFPAVLLDLVNQGHGEHLRQFLRTGRLPGPNQQPWIGTFGQSSDTPLGFIIRELVRLGVITAEAVYPYAFYVCRPALERALQRRVDSLDGRVQKLSELLGSGDEDDGENGETRDFALPARAFFENERRCCERC